MVLTLEAVRGGGGSVKVGTTGTISALMSREIESSKSASKAPSQRNPVSGSSGSIASRKMKHRKLVDEGSSGNTSHVKTDRCPALVRKANLHYTGRTHHIPMLEADNISLEGTPIRQKSFRNKSGIVEIVDINCGNPNKRWARPITNRLKKFGFAKLSTTIGY